MEPEIIVAMLAIFVSGGAMGAVGTLLGQWVLRRISPASRRNLGSHDPRVMEQLRAEVADLSTRLHSVDTRLEFTEQLLGGALLGSSPPEPLSAPEGRSASAADRPAYDEVPPGSDAPLAGQDEER